MYLKTGSVRQSREITINSRFTFSISLFFNAAFFFRSSDCLRFLARMLSILKGTTGTKLLIWLRYGNTFLSMQMMSSMFLFLSMSMFLNLLVRLTLCWWSCTGPRTGCGWCTVCFCRTGSRFSRLIFGCIGWKWWPRVCRRSPAGICVDRAGTGCLAFSG